MLPAEDETANLLRLRITGGTGADEAVIYFHRQANDAYEDAFDAQKMLSGNPGVPNLYSYFENADMSINVLGAFTHDREVPLGVVITQNGNYTISVLEMLHFDATTMVYLEDRQKNEFYNLRTTKDIVLALTSSTIRTRFFIHFYQPVSVSVTRESCLLNDGSITLNNPSSSAWDVSLLTADGLGIVATVPGVTGEHVFFGLAGGEYMLKLQKPSDGYSSFLHSSITAGEVAIADFSVPGDSTISGSPVKFTADDMGEGYTYHWDFGDGSLASGPERIRTHTYAFPGIYTVTLLVNYEACSDARAHTILIRPEDDIITGIGEKENGRLFFLHPNPANTIVTITLSDPLVEQPEWIEIRDVSGRLLRRELLKGMMPGGAVSLVVDHLLPGTYYASLLSGNGQLHTRPFSISR